MPPQMQPTAPNSSVTSNTNVLAQATTEQTEAADNTALPLPIIKPTTVVMETFYTTRGSFDKKLAKYLGKSFTVQGRWVNTTDDSKSSEWSDFVSIIIS